jgi:hypothetical protein
VDSWQNQPSIREPLVFSTSGLIPNSRNNRWYREYRESRYIEGSYKAIARHTLGNVYIKGIRPSMPHARSTVAKMAKEQDGHTPARLLPISLAFYCWALHAKMKIARNGAGSPAYAI